MPAKKMNVAKKYRRQLIWLGQISVSAGILYVLFRLVNIERIAAQLRAVAPAELAAPAVLGILSILFCGFRMRLLLPSQYSIPLTTSVATYYSAVFLNVFLPGGFAGELLKYRLLRKFQARPSAVALLVFLERLMGATSLLALAAGSTLLFGSDSVHKVMAAGFLATLVFGVGGLAARAYRVIEPWSQATSAVSRDLDALSRSSFLQAFALSGLNHLSYLFSGLLLARALEIPLGSPQIVLGLCLSALGSMLPFSYQGVGVREALLVYTAATDPSLAPQITLLGALLSFLGFFTAIPGAFLALALWDKNPRMLSAQD